MSNGRNTYIVAMQWTNSVIVTQRWIAPSYATNTRWAGSVKPSDTGMRKGAAM